jgi:anti-anti-sigma factor
MATFPEEAQRQDSWSEGDSLELIVRHGRSRALVRVIGALDCQTAAKLRGVMTTLTSAATREVEVDLAQLTFVDVAGARALVEVSDAVERRGGRLWLRNFPSRLRQVGEALHLERYVELAPDCDITERDLDESG